jgi:predicted DNA binding CopG/RHH family protein
LKSTANARDEIRDAKAAARNTFNKNKRVNLRLTEQDHDLAHIKALQDGIPYQTLLSSVIHKYLTGQLIEK